MNHKLLNEILYWYSIKSFHTEVVTSYMNHRTVNGQQKSFWNVTLLTNNVTTYQQTLYVDECFIISESHKSFVVESTLKLFSSCSNVQKEILSRSTYIFSLKKYLYPLCWRPGVLEVTPAPFIKTGGLMFKRWLQEFPHKKGGAGKIKEWLLIKNQWDFTNM